LAYRLLGFAAFGRSRANGFPAALAQGSIAFGFGRSRRGSRYRAIGICRASLGLYSRFDSSCHGATVRSARVYPDAPDGARTTRRKPVA
jgi:hypothetical protein